MLLLEGQRGRGLVVEGKDHPALKDDFGSSNYHLLASEICDAAREVSLSVSRAHALDNDESTMLQMACSFLLLCLVERETAARAGEETAQYVLELTRFFLAGRACGILFPDSDKSTLEYFLLLFENNLKVCREEIMAAVVSSESSFQGGAVLRSWLEECACTSDVANDAWRLLKEAWEKGSFVSLISSIITS